VIAYGVSRKGTGKGKEEGEATKAIRVCCDCNAIVVRKQYIHEAHTSTAFTRLYDAFISLEHEISQALSQIEVLIPALISSPTLESLSHRKHLTTLFSDYDALAKRIKSLPYISSSSVGGGPVHDQDRVQAAIWARAVGFMQANMGILQRLPKIEHKSSRSTSTIPVDLVQDERPESLNEKTDSKLAHVLQPLLEQEALLESFISEATTQRKFEDVKSLKANLAEIRGEIGNLSIVARGHGNGNGARTKLGRR